MVNGNDKNKVGYVLITGAYGGMGYKTAKLLSEKGFTVFALDKKVNAAEPNIFPIETDITDTENIKHAYDIVKAQTSGLDAIIHFAGVYMLDSLVEMKEERFTKIFDINVFGTYRVNKIFLPLLSAGSTIVITSSELAPLNPLPFTGIYAITKTALEKYAFSLRMELQLLGINVSVLRPGAVKTGLLSASTAELDNFCKNTKIYTYNAEKFKKITSSVEAKNVLPEKIAKKALHAITARHPKYVYNINKNPLLRILNILPKKIQTKIIGKILKPEKSNKTFSKNKEK